MTATKSPWEEHLQQLKEEFDASFLRAHEDVSESVERILLVRCGGGLYGLRARDLAAFLPCPPITPLPGAPSDLLGIIGHHGNLVAVYDLGAHLSQGQGQTAHSWLVLYAKEPSLGFAFAQVEGLAPLSIPKTQLQNVANTPETSESGLSVIALPAIPNASHSAASAAFAAETTLVLIDLDILVRRIPRRERVSQHRRNIHGAFENI